MLIDPTGGYVKVGAAAMGRAINDQIISGFFVSTKTGENGSSDTVVLGTFNSGSQVVPANTGSSVNTGLNIAKLRAAKRLLLAAEVDIDNDLMFMAISAKQHDYLLK